jgi:hypothetical protein
MMADWESWSGKPFMIVEFYVKGMDSGLANTSGAGSKVRTQTDRGYWYQNFTMKLLSSKGCVGWHWFEYLDNDPANPRNNHTNKDSNKGIETWDYQPYPVLLNSMKQLNDNTLNLISYFGYDIEHVQNESDTLKAWQPSNYRNSKQPCYAVQNGSAQRTGKNQTTIFNFGGREAYITSFQGTPLDTTVLTETWRDDFNTMDISGPDGSDAKWYAPIHGAACGAAKCLPPEQGPLGADFPTGPFSVKNGLLTITGKVADNGKWYSGVMETVDREGYGFAQQYGYFECRVKFPFGKATWPAFWLKAAAERTDFSMSRPEIDAIEWYGSDAKGYHACLHLWRAKEANKWGSPMNSTGHKSYIYDLRKWIPEQIDREKGALEGFHTYGVEFTPLWVIFYFDRKEIVRHPMFPEYHQPMFMLIDNAIVQKDAAEAQGIKEMVVDYVTVYQFTERLNN